VFFSTPEHRERARAAIARAFPAATAIARDVDDEDWARRSQENLGPVTVGRVTVMPPWVKPETSAPSEGSGLVRVVIQPSMAFGTAHHATTRLCLVAMQMLNLSGTNVLDIGTGSGVLAIAARLLGAEGALGIDNDPDAITCAKENLELNPTVNNVRFRVGDLLSAGNHGASALHVARGLQLGAPDVIVANLTGDLLQRTAAQLGAAFAPGGGLIVSGLLVDERDAVVAALAELDLVWEAEEEGWVGLGFARLSYGG
jgi:ribosomal protein L11 methyltransferase